MTQKQNYVVKMPTLLKYVYLILFISGLFLFVFFAILKINGNPSITNGNFLMALIISAIGLVVMSYATKWQIVVEQGKMEIHRPFHKTKIFRMSELNRVQKGKKSELILSANGKKLVVVDPLCDNYELLKKNLKEVGKLS